MYHFYYCASREGESGDSFYVRMEAAIITWQWIDKDFLTQTKFSTVRVVCAIFESPAVSQYPQQQKQSHFRCRCNPLLAMLTLGIHYFVIAMGHMTLLQYYWFCAISCKERDKCHQCVILEVICAVVGWV